MIPDMWYAVLESSEVRKGQPRGFRRLGEDLVFWRDSSGQIAVMNDRCPHRSASLSRGKIIGDNIQCPFHGFQFNSAGLPQLIPANGRNGSRPAGPKCVTRVAREAHGLVWIWNGSPCAEYPQLPWFDDLEGLTCSSFQAHWDTHYTRAIEGMLDVSHLPFVHARTIGRRNSTLVNGPYTTIQDGKIRVWPDNQPDTGLPAIKPTELPPPDKPPGLLFNFPNLWQLRIAAGMRIVNIIVPVDDEATVIYLRTYQGMTRNRLFGWLFTETSNIMNRYVLREDYKIARNQRPKRSGLEIGEHFIPADRPIALYLQHKRQMQRLSGIKEESPHASRAPQGVAV